MLIVIAIIILLLSLLIVGLNRATKSAQSARTQGLLTAISQGLVQFEGDVGYYPPVLDADRELLYGPDIDLSDSAYSSAAQDWYSLTSLAEYLVGYGDRPQDGYGRVATPGILISEEPFTGIRHPGPDGVWGAGTGSIAMRDPINDGKVFGPYLELDDDRLLASIDDAGQISLPGEAGYDAEDPKVILDFWGEPIQYFRRNYPPGGITQSYRATDRDLDGAPDAAPTLSDVIRLRPFDIPPGRAKDTRFGDHSAASDPTTTYELDSAEFALFSSGPDRAYEKLVRADLPGYDGDPEEGDELNRDNLVEAGP